MIILYTTSYDLDNIDLCKGLVSEGIHINKGNSTNQSLKSYWMRI